MHARNRHKAYLDYWDLAERQPSLEKYVYTNAYGGASIDYTDQKALQELTNCLLREFYDIVGWSIPEGYLCPPVPQRADYIHNIADLLVLPGSSAESPELARGPGVRGLDIGTGASCIYSLLGAREYGWSFIGSDIDRGALDSARTIVARNSLRSQIDLRLQSDPGHIFRGVLREGEQVAFCVCNPPFHESLDWAARAASTKWQRLGRSSQGEALNYQGKPSELCCEGGEVGFVKRMAEESAQDSLRGACLWFSAMRPASRLWSP